MGVPGLQSCKTRLANKSSSHYMYLLSPGGETLFLIPGVGVVHKAPATLNIPEETKGKITNKVAAVNMEGKMQPPTQGGGRKRQNLTLDLNSASAKRTKLTHLLTSPDVQMLKLTSPELEHFLSLNPTLATPTPSGYISTKSVTKQHAVYKDFQEALDNLKQTKPVPTGVAVNTLNDEQDPPLLNIPTLLPHTQPMYNEKYAADEGTQVKYEADEQDLSEEECTFGSPNTKINLQDLS